MTGKQYRELWTLIFLYKMAYHNTKKALHKNKPDEVWKNYKKYDRIEDQLLELMNSLVEGNDESKTRVC